MKGELQDEHSLSMLIITKELAKLAKLSTYMNIPPWLSGTAVCLDVSGLHTQKNDCRHSAF